MVPLSDIKKENSFGVPDGYFNSVTDQIQSKIAEEKLKDQYGNKNPFTVPQGYFQNFSVNTENSGKGKIISIFKPWLSIAAGILIVFAAWQIVLTSLDTGESSLTSVDTSDFTEQLQYAEIFDFSNINDSDLEDAITDYIQEYDEETINAITTEKLEDDTEISEENEIIYEYYIDYSDDYSDYEELLAEL